MNWKKKIKNRIFIFFVVLFILSAYLLYIFDILYNSKNILTVKIISPYNCNYQFLFTEDSLFVISENYYNNTNEKKGNNNLVTAVKIDEKNIIYIKNLTKSVLKENRKIDNGSSNDLYKYEVSVNNTLIRKSLCCEDDITNLILQVVIPNIEVKNVVCDPFFNMIIERGSIKMPPLTNE